MDWAVFVSQNHVAVEFGRHSWNSSSPTACSKQNHLGQAAHGSVLWVLNNSKDGESTASLGDIFNTKLTVQKFVYLFIYLL